MRINKAALILSGLGACGIGLAGAGVWALKAGGYRPNQDSELPRVEMPTVMVGTGSSQLSESESLEGMVSINQSTQYDVEENGEEVQDDGVGSGKVGYFVAERDKVCASLASFTSEKPNFDDLRELVSKLADEAVFGEGVFTNTDGKKEVYFYVPGTEIRGNLIEDTRNSFRVSVTFPKEFSKSGLYDASGINLTVFRDNYGSCIAAASEVAFEGNRNEVVRQLEEGRRHIGGWGVMTSRNGTTYQPKYLVWKEKDDGSISISNSFLSPDTFDSLRFSQSSSERGSYSGWLQVFDRFLESN